VARRGREGTRKVGPYESLLSMPDIMTFIEKDSFERIANRAREERKQGSGG